MNQAKYGERICPYFPIRFLLFPVLLFYRSLLVRLAPGNVHPQLSQVHSFIVPSRLVYFVEITSMFLMTTLSTVKADWIIQTIPSDVPCIITVNIPFLKSVCFCTSMAGVLFSTTLDAFSYIIVCKYTHLTYILMVCI